MGEERSANAIDKKIGDRVRTRRLQIDMSQERLADLLGVTFQQVQKYEKGVNRIAASRLYDIAHALDLPVAAFFEGLTSRRGSGASIEDDSAAALAAPGAHELLRLYAGIANQRLRRRVLELVRAMNDEDDVAR